MLASGKGLSGLIAPGLLIVGAIFALRLSADIEQLGFDPLDSAFFPRLIAGLILAIASLDFVLNLIRIVTLPPEARQRILPDRDALIRAGLAYLFFVLFCVNAAFGPIRFPYSGILFMLLCGAVYLDRPTKAEVAMLVAASIGLPVLVNAAFSYFFYVQIP